MFQHHSRRSVVALGAPLAAALLCAAGCSTADRWRMNPTPRVDTLARTTDGVKNQMSISTDTNLRQLNEDLGRMFFFDRPTRMARSPVPY